MKPTLQLTFPSKTYLVGEYGVLVGGEALLLSTSPCFAATLSRTTKPQAPPFSPESPAGKLLAAHPEVQQHVCIAFHDLHQGQGGFGASGAQFLTALAATQWLQRDALQLTLPAALAAYRRFLPPSTPQPSGGDLAAQLTGQVTHFDAATGGAQAHSWPFPQLGFVVLRTGHHLPTHQHLAQLEPRPLLACKAAAAPVVQYFLAGDGQAFCAALQTFQATLVQTGLQSPSTEAFITQLQRQPACRVAKGCGALGAEVVMALVEQPSEAIFLQWCRQQQLTVVATTQDLYHFKY